MILPAVGLALAFLAGGAIETGLVVGSGIAIWLWSGLLSWRRPTRAGLSALLRAGCLSGFASALLLLPSLARPSTPRSIQLSAAACVAAWGARMALLSRAAGIHLALSPVARTTGILAASSVLGGSYLFWSQVSHVARLTGPHDPYEAARLQVAYAGGIGLVLVVPILLFIGTAIYLMLRDEA